MITHNNNDNTLYGVIILSDNYQLQHIHSSLITLMQPSHLTICMQSAAAEGTDNHYPSDKIWTLYMTTFQQ